MHTVATAASRPTSHRPVLPRLANALCALPAAWLVGQTATARWGANPLQALLQLSGQSALVLLLLSLGLPLLRSGLVALARRGQAKHGRRLSDWNPLMRLRRTAGLWAFAYAALHLALYATLDAGGDSAALWADLLERPAMPPGWLALAGLALLAASSIGRVAAWLGPWWPRLHQTAPWLAALALAHIWLHLKLGQPRPWVETAVLGLILAARAWRRWRGDAAPDHEVPGR